MLDNKIKLEPYNPKWPEFFEKEAGLLKLALGKNFSAIYHIGSTSVPGLTAKPKLDILAVVHDLKSLDYQAFLNIGYLLKGEYNIPFRIFGSKREEDIRVNLHLFKKNDSSIELNLLFRDYIRKNPNAQKEYAALKVRLASLENSGGKNSNIGLLNYYNLGKNQFILSVIEKSGFDGLVLRFAAHYSEIEAAKKFAGNFYTEDENHKHFILYKGVNIIGYAFLELKKGEAYLHLLSFEEGYQNFDKYLLGKCQEWAQLHDFEFVVPYKS